MGSERFIDLSRLNEAAREELLNRLDRDAGSRKPSNRRGPQRLSYRASDIAMTISHPGGSLSRFLVSARNLSAGGMAFIHGGYLHVGTECRLVLVPLAGPPKVLAGTVRRCRHLTRHLHEVGIEFYEKIDPTHFCDPLKPDRAPQVTSAASLAQRASAAVPAIDGTMLYVSNSDLDRQVMQQRLAMAGVNVVTADCIGVAADHVKRLPLQLVMVEMNLAESSGAESVRRIREAGYTGPMIAVASSDSEEQQTQGRSADAVLPRPFTATALLSIVRSKMQRPETAAQETEPIWSDRVTRGEDPRPIEKYVQEVRQLSVAARRMADCGDWARLRTIVASLRGSGTGYGFPAVTEAGKLASQAFDRNEPPEDLRRRVDYLLEICDRLSAAAPPKAA
ncbi:MAG: response regulator [Phycisphaerales bacterium]|nr:response regulator [Phycisphaerales bacterium]